MTKRTQLLFGFLGAGGLVAGALVLRGGASFGRVDPIEPPAPAGAASRTISLAPGSRAKNPVKVAPAELAKIAGDIQAVGTVAFHEDHYALVGPLVSGRISRLVAGVGDQVRRGQILAEIESAEVGQARADSGLRQGPLRRRGRQPPPRERPR